MIEAARAKAMPIWTTVKEFALNAWAKAVAFYEQASAVYQRYFDVLAGLVGRDLAQKLVIGISAVLVLTLFFLFVRYQTRPRDDFDYDDYDTDVSVSPAE